jgi:hypothetical protein
VDLRFNSGLFLFIPVPASARSPPYSRRPDTVPPPRISSPWRLRLFCITLYDPRHQPCPSIRAQRHCAPPARVALNWTWYRRRCDTRCQARLVRDREHRCMIHLVPCFHYRSCPPPPDLPLSPLSLCLICTSVGPRFPEHCAFVRVHRSTCSSCLPLSPLVVLRFHVSRTWYMVSYIACIVIYPVPQSEYRLCSPPTFVHRCDIVPFPSTSPSIPRLASVLPRAGLAK